MIEKILALKPLFIKCSMCMMLNVCWHNLVQLGAGFALKNISDAYISIDKKCLK